MGIDSIKWILMQRERLHSLDQWGRRHGVDSSETLWLGIPFVSTLFKP